MPCRLKHPATLATLLAIIVSPAAAGSWKHEVVANDGDVLTYSDNGKLGFYLGCGRGFAIHVKYPGEAMKEGDAEIAISTSKGRMSLIGEFEDPDVFGGTDFHQAYLGYRHSDPRVFGRKWNATKARRLNMLDAKGPIRIAAGKASYTLPPIDVTSDWHKAIEACKN